MVDCKKEAGLEEAGRNCGRVVDQEVVDMNQNAKVAGQKGHCESLEMRTGK